MVGPLTTGRLVYLCETEVARSWILKDSQSLMFIRGAGCAMAKATKFLRKQADKAERRARVTADAEISESLLNLAKAYRTSSGRVERLSESRKRSDVDAGI